MNKDVFCLPVLAFCLCLARTPLSAGQSLPRSTPEAEGISSPGILAFITAVDKDEAKYAVHSFMLVRHGKVVAEGWWKPHSPDESHVLHSISKSFTSTAVGLAVAEGKLSIDDPVLKFFPDEAPASPSDNLRAMRVRDLLTMTCGHETVPKLTGTPSWVRTFLAYPVPHAPGTHFLYDSTGVYMLSAIVQKVTGQTVLDYLRPRIFSPLGISDPVWDASPEGVTMGSTGLRLRTEEIAEFGQLYLQKGRWNGAQLIPQSWVEAATSKEVPNDEGTGARHVPNSRQGYGFNFWMTTHEGYRAAGSGGQYCLVFPKLDTVIVTTADSKAMDSLLAFIVDNLLPAIKPGPLPADAAGLDQLRQTLSNLAIPSHLASNLGQTP
jgi:CubicO group peptidase (beta-lactamase class C family)